MNSIGDIARTLNRSAVYLTGLQARFELPVLSSGEYSEAYVEFLRNVVALRIFNVSEEALRDLWHWERKFLQLIHADSAGSPTWFLDACGETTFPERRLLLSNHDVGHALTGTGLQPGLNFSETPAELFAGPEMGEDTLRVLRECLKLRNRILNDVVAEILQVRAATKRLSAVVKRAEPAKANKRRV